MFFFFNLLIYSWLTTILDPEKTPYPPAYVEVYPIISQQEPNAYNAIGWQHQPSNVSQGFEVQSTQSEPPAYSPIQHSGKQIHLNFFTKNIPFLIYYFSSYAFSFTESITHWIIPHQIDTLPKLFTRN